MNITSILEFTSLRVLNATGEAIEDLPPSINNFKHMRYLNLSRSRVLTLPNSVCSLWNLQILNLDYCYRLVALPKKLTSLHNLQHLCLWGCKSLCEMPSKMRELNGLKILSMFVVGLKSDNQLEELQYLNLSGRLEIRHLERVKDAMDAKKAKIAEKNNLRKLRLSWKRFDASRIEEEIDEMVLEALEPHPNLESLSIYGFSGRYLPSWMSNSTMGKIVKIDVSDCENCRHFPKLGELPHLESVSLTNVGVEYIIEEETGNGIPVKIQFLALKSLKLTDLPNLKGFSKEQGSKEAFPNLEVLWIERCSSLILPPLSSLQNLKELRCSSSTLALLPDMLDHLYVKIEKSLPCFEIETLAKFSTLKSLIITHAKEISVKGEGLQALKQLVSLCIGNCKTLRCLPEGVLRHLTVLEIFQIWECPQLEELPTDITHHHNLCGIVLEVLPKMTRLPHSFPHLTWLDLRGLPELESLPDQLPSLNSLSVINCPKVVSVPALPNVKRLRVTGCPQLERRCQRGSGEDWHKIAHIFNIYISPI